MRPVIDMEPVVTQVTFAELALLDPHRLAKYQIAGSVAVIGCEAPRLNWTLAVCLPPVGHWWQCAPTLGQTFEPWRREQEASSKVFREFQREVASARVALQDLPGWFPCGFIDARGQSAPISANAEFASPLDDCAWWLPADEVPLSRFARGLETVLTEIGHWAFAIVDEWSSDEHEFTQRRPGTIPFRALAASGIERVIDEQMQAQIREWLVAATAQDQHCPLSPSQLRIPYANLSSLRYAPEEKTDLVAELAALRLALLEKHLPPSFIAAVRSEIDTLRNIDGRLKTVSLAQMIVLRGTTLAEELERKFPNSAADVLRMTKSPV
jgi:hypothetical protein